VLFQCVIFVGGIQWQGLQRLLRILFICKRRIFLSVPLDSEEYERKAEFLSILHQYVEGTYTIFPEKKKAVEIAVPEQGQISMFDFMEQEPQSKEQSIAAAVEKPKKDTFVLLHGKGLADKAAPRRSADGDRIQSPALLSVPVHRQASGSNPLVSGTHCHG